MSRKKDETPLSHHNHDFSSDAVGLLFNGDIGLNQILEHGSAGNCEEGAYELISGPFLDPEFRMAIWISDVSKGDWSTLQLPPLGIAPRS